LHPLFIFSPVSPLCDKSLFPSFHHSALLFFRLRLTPVFSTFLVFLFLRLSSVSVSLTISRNFDSNSTLVFATGTFPLFGNVCRSKGFSYSGSSWYFSGVWALPIVQKGIPALCIDLAFNPPWALHVSPPNIFISPLWNWTTVPLFLCVLIEISVVTLRFFFLSTKHRFSTCMAPIVKVG